MRENNGFQTVILSRGLGAGVVGHHQVDWRNRATALGYWVGEEFQGQGLVTAACRQLVIHSFDVLGLHRLEIRCAVGNRRSRGSPSGLDSASKAGSGMPNGYTITGAIMSSMPDWPRMRLTMTTSGG